MSKRLESARDSGTMHKKEKASAKRTPPSAARRISLPKNWRSALGTRHMRTAIAGQRAKVIGDIATENR